MFYTPCSHAYKDVLACLHNMCHGETCLHSALREAMAAVMAMARAARAAVIAMAMAMAISSRVRALRLLFGNF